MTRPLLIANDYWRVTFAWRGDRYGHRIEAREGGEWALLLESIEGEADEPWPPSPPLQQVHIEARDDGRQVALAVGMAGKSHWSLAMTVGQASRLPVLPSNTDAPDDNTSPNVEPVSLHVEAACRIKEKPLQVGLAYRCRCSAPVAIQPNRLEFGKHQRILQTTDQLQFESDAQRIDVCPAAGTVPATIRWGFELTLAREQA